MFVVFSAAFQGRHRFVDRSQFDALLRGLPEYLKPVAQFAYIKGWRIPSEVLKLQWPQIDFLAGEIRLNAGTTKNNEGECFHSLLTSVPS